MNTPRWIIRRVVCLFAITLLSMRAFGKPNVLFIVVDDLHASLGCYGAAATKTPNLDKLIARGTRFDRAYCQYPLCNPSRSSFLSSLRPETSGVLAQGDVLREMQPDLVTLPQLFKQNGWFTAGAGKVFHHTDAISWDEFDQSKPESGQEAEALKRRGDSKRDGRTKNGPEWLALDCEDAGTGDGGVARVVAAQMRRAVREGRPFFLGAGFRKPHLPWTAPKKYFGMYPPRDITVDTEPEMAGVPDIARITDLTGSRPPDSREEAIAAYYACVSFMDAQVGVLTETLDQLGLWDSTIVVFLSDHGYHLGDHGGLWAKLTDFERCARVPLAMVVPRMPAGAGCPRLVESLDVYPTLVELCGLPRPAQVEGRSLVPLLEDAGRAWEHPAYTTTVHEGVFGRSVRTERWRYTEWDDGGRGAELYDQDADPENYRNLAADAASARVIAEMKRLLAQVPRTRLPAPRDAQSRKKDS